MELTASISMSSDFGKWTVWNKLNFSGIGVFFLLLISRIFLSLIARSNSLILISISACYDCVMIRTLCFRSAFGFFLCYPPLLPSSYCRASSAFLSISSYAFITESTIAAKRWPISGFFLNLISFYFSSWFSIYRPIWLVIFSFAF